MEAKVKKITQKITESEDDEFKETIFTTKLENMDKSATITVKEFECTFHVGDMWEFKKIETQTTLDKTKPTEY